MIRIIEALVIVVVYLALSPFARGQTLNGKLLRLNPTTLPVMCAIGDIRVDSGDDYKLKLCDALNTWNEISPTGVIINPMTTAGDMIYGGASGVPTRLATSTGLLHAGTPPSWSLLVDADVSGSAAIAYSKLNLTGAILNADLAGSIADTKLDTIATALKVSNSATTAASANTASAIVARDASGNFSAGTITATLTGNVTGNLTGDVTGNVSGSSGSTTGNAATATALASNPTDCGANTKATAIDASGNLTCSSVANADLAGSIAAAKLIGTDITTVGTITTGTWSADVIAIARGGTNNGSLGVTAGGALYTDGSKLANIGAGSSGQVFTSQGASAPIWADSASAPTRPAPTVQTFLSSSATYNKNYAFVISSGSATVGATYTNNSVTFTVYATVSSATLVYMSGSGAPDASGTLTKSAGTGDATLTFSSVIAPLYLRVRMVGGGGGGGSSGSSGAAAGTSGTATTFGTTLLSAGGGTGGAASTTGMGGAGGSSSLGTGPVGLALSGGTGGNSNFAAAGTSASGGLGGVTVFGGYGSGDTATGGGTNGIANTGAGAGGGFGITGTGRGGGGGGSGGFVDAIITNPSATYAYVVGPGGAGASAGTSGYAGGAGATGLITVEEYY